MDQATQRQIADILREKGMEPMPPSHGMAIPPDLKTQPIPTHSEVSAGVMIDLGDQETFDAFQKKYADQIKAGGPISIDAADEKKFRKLQVTE